MRDVSRAQTLPSGWLGFILTALILAAVLLTSHVSRNSNSVATVLLNSSPTYTAGSSTHKGAYLLQFLNSHYSMEHAWNYCWMESSYFLNNPTPADPQRTTLSQFEKVVVPGQLVTWRLDTFDSTGKPLGTGGDAISVVIQGPSLLRPAVYDLRNGTYLVAFSLIDEGSYTADISMRWQSCFAYAFCNVNHTQQPISQIKRLEFFVQQLRKDEIITTREITFLGSGRWVDKALVPKDATALLENSLLKGPFIWLPFNGKKLRVFPTINLRNKWIYIIGDSLSEHAFDEMLETVFKEKCGGGHGPNTKNESPVHVLINRYDGKRMEEQWKRDGMQLYHCPSLNLTFSFVFYPDSFPVGGYKNTRFPLINEEDNSIAAASNVTFKVPEWTTYLKAAMKKHPGVPSHTFPDAVVFNFGLHFATPLDPPLYTVLLRHMLMMLREQFPSGSRTKFLWRSTAWTHFEKEKMALKWNCRTPIRTQIMNEISNKLVDAMGTGVDGIVDFQELTAARADATPDNRHFSDGNIRATFNNLLLNKLNDVLPVT
ncbi:hypothetical protein Ndes2526B_g07414 [Nannochloris sp. 'desiccata']|nr:hypothetical protein KSW81_004582 [Chlorella desiccata (nom. nud.)]KAH7618470.1 hypothetical protein NADE_000662 [Chlorella desiccata (nom. nud.)]